MASVVAVSCNKALSSQACSIVVYNEFIMQFVLVFDKDSFFARLTKEYRFDIAVLIIHFNCELIMNFI